MTAKDKGQTINKWKNRNRNQFLNIKDHFFNRQTKKGKNQIGKGTKDKSHFHPEGSYKLLSDLRGLSLGPWERDANEKCSQMWLSPHLTARIKKVEATFCG